MRRRVRPVAAIVMCVMLLGIGAVGARASGDGGTSHEHPAAVLSAVRTHALNLADRLGIRDDETPAAPGTLDDGRDMLPQARISIQQAIQAAQSASTGALGEIDLEHYQGRLVFNVDVGDKDVKVDAVSGKVLSADSEN